ncbi:MAG: replicative DNA helicase [Candidatus Brennerbacteria bacterium]|nr:replicative DNA helicase [Candidatus Brennerbacteria bacterium]
MDPKLPPQDLEAEQSVLGALMIDKNAIIKVADFLYDGDFYKPTHQKIYNAILKLFEKNEPIDLLSLTSQLKKDQNLEAVGGSSYLADLINSVPSASNIEHYAKIVRQKRVLRDLINVSAEVTEKAFSGGEFEPLIDGIEQRIFGISQHSRKRSFVHLKDELQGAYERIEKLHQGGGVLRGVPTGFNDLDNYLSGLQKSDLVILGARPSFGKTALVLDIARQAAVKHRQPVGIFSLEMSREQVIDRLISAEAQVPLWRLRTGKLNDEMDFAMIQNGLDKLSQTPIFIDDTPSPDIFELRSAARRLQIEHGLSLLIIDYLQLIRPRRNTESMVQQITEISRSLKALARELDIPVLAVSQLSRAVDQREIKIPKLSDLRESGSIEQDADVVMFIYRKDRDKIDITPEEQNLTEIIIAKHRNGPTGSVKLKFDPEKVCFRNIDKIHS